MSTSVCVPAPRKLSRARIVREAIALVDEEGLDALTMRRLGERLGVEGMSLYRYVGNKAGLLDAIHDGLLGQMTFELTGDDWETDVRRLAHAFRAVLRAHPRALPMFSTRPARGPNALRQVEAGLAILDRAGLCAADALATFQVVFAYVVGHAVYTLRDGSDDALDYATLAPGLPHVAGLGDVLVDRDIDQEFELGLDLLLAGLHARLK